VEEGAKKNLELVFVVGFLCFFLLAAAKERKRIPILRASVRVSIQLPLFIHRSFSVDGIVPVVEVKISKERDRSRSHTPY